VSMGFPVTWIDAGVLASKEEYGQDRDRTLAVPAVREYRHKTVTP
jgi:hypothetical protein